MMFEGYLGTDAGFLVQCRQVKSICGSVCGERELYAAHQKSVSSQQANPACHHCFRHPAVCSSRSIQHRNKGKGLQRAIWSIALFNMKRIFGERQKRKVSITYHHSTGGHVYFDKLVAKRNRRSWHDGALAQRSMSKRKRRLLL